VLKGFLRLIKNKTFLTSLLITNAVLFVFGFIISDINLMLLSVLSYAAVFLSLEINKDSSDKEDD
tara:strand:+ start:118 stop:312 length:195 start_codon:yes stop_codon:yes gene_type:complete